jgi:hypothetical protein
MDQLLQKLMVSKAIMDKHKEMPRGDSRNIQIPSTQVENFDAPQARYNIPQEFLSESQSTQAMSNTVRENTKPVGSPSVDAIKNSKLPDEIKRLMMEHPISQPQQLQPTISDELIEKASRLMRKSNDNNYIPESAKTNTKSTQTQSFDYTVIKNMIEEAVKNALKENGVISESQEKTNEIFSFKVGKHIFEGKVTKIKKLS